jgi:hypothetical protein
MTDETYIFLRLKSAEVYASAQAAIDESRGYPDGLTQQAMPNWDDLKTGNDGNKYLFIDRWRTTPTDAAMLEQLTQAGHADIIGMDEYEQMTLEPDLFIYDELDPVTEP